MNGWCAALADGETSVYPLGDLRDHDPASEHCWCRPFRTLEGILVHNSADGRESFERGERLPS